MTFIKDLIKPIKEASFIISGNMDLEFRIMTHYKEELIQMRKAEYDKLHEYVNSLDDIIEYSYIPGSISPTEGNFSSASTVDGYEVTIKYIDNK